MKQYPDDIVITIDDDIIYAPSTFQTLYNSYLMHPNAVSAMRTNLITTSQRKEVLPYKQWINEADAYVDEPSMYLLATGVMGVLYPPKSISSDLFDKQGILDTCLFADDLWLKTMEMMNGTPVVLADIYRPLQYVPNSQETSLYQHNVDLDENDLQLNNIQNWIDSRYGEGTWIQKLTTPVFDVDMSDTRVICENFARRDSRHKYDLRHTSDRLKTAWAQKSEINAKLQKTYQEKFDRGVEIKQLKEKLKKAKSEKAEINAKLKAERAKNKKLMRYKKNMESKLVVRVYRKLKRIARKLLGRK